MTEITDEMRSRMDTMMAEMMDALEGAIERTLEIEKVPFSEVTPAFWAEVVAMQETNRAFFMMFREGIPLSSKLTDSAVVRDELMTVVTDHIKGEAS